MRRTFSQGLTVATVALSITVGITGCGAINSLSAKQKVSKAMSSFADADSALFTLSLDTTSSDVAAIAQAAGEPMTAADTKVLDRFLDADVSYAVQAADGQKLGDTMDSSKQAADFSAMAKDPAAFSAYLKKAGAVAMAVRLGGKPLAEFRMVNGVAYAHAAVPKILQLAGEDPAELDRALADVPPSLAPLAKAARGSWVSVDLGQVMKTLSDQGGLDELSGTATPAPSPSVDPAAVNKLLEDLKAAYEQKVTITELPKSDRGEGYQLSASPRQVAAAVQDDVIKLVGAAAGPDVKQGFAKIPEKPVNLNVWIKDDKLTGVALDLTQFLDDKPAGAKMAVDIAVGLGSGKVAAPSGATPLDVSALIEEATSFGATMGGGFSGSGSTLGDPFADYPGLPKSFRTPAGA